MGYKLGIFNDFLAVGFSCFWSWIVALEVERCLKLSLYSLNSGFIHIHDNFDPALDIIMPSQSAKDFEDHPISGACFPLSQQYQ